MLRVFLNKNRVDVILARKNKNKIWMAKQIGVSPGHLYQMLGNMKAPSTSLRAKIMKVLDIKGEDWNDIFQIQNSDSRS